MAIQSKPLKELSPRHQQLFERALSSYRSGDAVTAAATLADIVREEPGCADVRKALRAAQLDVLPEQKAGAMQRCRYLVHLFLVQTKGKSLLNNDKYREALALAEDLLQADPRSRPALMFLAKAGDKARVPKIAEDALELLVKLYPDNPRCWRALADHSLKVGHGRRALAALRKLRSYYPDDVELKAEINQAKAAAVMDMESWEKATSAREPAPEEAPEDAGADETSAQDVQEAQDRAHQANAKQREPEDEQTAAAARAPNEHRRKLKAQIMMKKRRQAAASAAQTAVPKPDEAPLTEREYTAEIAKLDGAIEQWQIYGRTHPDKREDADREIDAIEKKRHAVMRKHLEDQLKLRPQDLEQRFELGLLVLEDEEWDYAIEQFQATRRDPDLKARSLANLGRSMAGKGLIDLAATQLEAALDAGFGEDETSMLAAKYDLATLYEELDREEEAAALLKEIYAADITFRDVSFRVERLYAGGNAE